MFLQTLARYPSRWSRCWQVTTLTTFRKPESLTIFRQDVHVWQQLDLGHFRGPWQLRKKKRRSSGAAKRAEVRAVVEVCEVEPRFRAKWDLSPFYGEMWLQMT